MSAQHPTPLKDDGSLGVARLLEAYWRGRKEMAAILLREGAVARGRVREVFEARDLARQECIRWIADRLTAQENSDERIPRTPS